MGMSMSLRRVSKTELDELTADASSVPALLTSPGDILDIDKSWHAIHYLLTEDPVRRDLPDGFLMGGDPIGEDMGYGPALMLRPELVAQIDMYLAVLPDDYVESNFDFDALRETGIYPNVWDRRDPADIEYISGHFERLKTFVTEAAAAKQGLLLAIR